MHEHSTCQYLTAPDINPIDPKGAPATNHLQTATTSRSRTPTTQAHPLVMTTTATQRGAPPPPPPQSARSTPSDQTQATTSTPSTPNTPGMPRHSDIDQEHIDKRHSDTTTAPAQATATKIALDQTTQVRPRAARQVTSRRANQQTTMQARRRHDEVAPGWK